MLSTQLISYTGLAGDKGTPPVVMYVSAKNGLPDTEQTWAKYLQENGYRTQAVGMYEIDSSRNVFLRTYLLPRKMALRLG